MGTKKKSLGEIAQLLRFFQGSCGVEEAGWGALNSECDNHRNLAVGRGALTRFVVLFYALLRGVRQSFPTAHPSPPSVMFPSGLCSAM